MEKITKERYDYALNVLPPYAIEGSAFMLGEMVEGFTFDAFDVIDGKYWHLGCLTLTQFKYWVKYKILI